MANVGTMNRSRNIETLFVPYAKKNATYVIEETLIDSTDYLVAAVLSKNGDGQHGCECTG
jgi:hypothetical protein